MLCVVISTGPQRDRTGSYSSVDSLNSDRSTPTSGLDDRLKHLRDLQRASSFDEEEEDDTADDKDKTDRDIDDSQDTTDQPNIEIAKDVDLPSFHELMGNGA